MIPSIAFIILNYKDAETVISLVDSLIPWKQDRFSRKIVIVDNCSPDDSFARLRERYDEAPDIAVLQTERNGGYSYGNNYGSRFAIHQYAPDYIAIANPDIMVTEDTIASLLETFAWDNSICVCSPTMLNREGRGRAYTNTLPTYSYDLWACFGEIRTKSSRNGAMPRKLSLENYPTAILTEMVPGSFFVARSDYYETVGMLDENVFLFCEERILGYHLKQSRYKVVIRSDLGFIHAHSVSINKSLKALQTRKILLKSRYYYQKTYGQATPMQLCILWITGKASLAAMALVGAVSAAKKKIQGKK